MKRPKNLRPGVWITYDSGHTPFLIEHGDHSFRFYTGKIHARAIDGTEIALSKEDLDKVSITQAPIEKQFTEGDTVILSPDFPIWLTRNGLFHKGRPYRINKVGNKGSINLIDEEGRDSIYISNRYFLHLEKIAT